MARIREKLTIDALKGILKGGEVRVDHPYTFGKFLTVQVNAYGEVNICWLNNKGDLDSRQFPRVSGFLRWYNRQRLENNDKETDQEKEKRYRF